MTTALLADGISKQYGSTTAVNHLELQVKRGEIFGLLGGNGAGKTTTMRMVLGLIYPDGGRIVWDGKERHPRLSKLMGYLPEERGLYPKVRVSEQLIYLAQLRGLKAKEADRNLKKWLERFGVPEYYDKRVEELSKGNQQKIQFIASIIHDPQILLMDEPFSGLDPVNVELLKDTVKELRNEGKSILFSSHRMDHVEELCENICILHKSNTVLKGNLKQIKQTFRKEKVVLETTGQVTGLEQLSGVEQVGCDNGRYMIRIKDEGAAPGILEHAMKQAIIHRFQVMEPTLNEIFIQKVGVSHE
ncbi:ATP-binding cassette domain-containing protein [Paenibacillus larvae]|uniref:ABC transporter ATP-binding protein n=1 Tax=Paenibacillus larvae TaxID=1464 RepID=UPI002280A9B1|nr:ATP-binding cassette domain-containing protein [Paenibacillus larvae]MCY9511662.1 ATP-binding cassette domain-containing protein [Paenibacillus larvae]MCY9525766.1 ATP-binding cassette domain-containing protein [Paenibacillus larvae]